MLLSINLAWLNHLLLRYAEIKNAGAVRHLFKDVGIITTSNAVAGNPVTLEQAEEHAIEVGAEEVELHDDSVQVREIILSIHRFF